MQDNCLVCDKEKKAPGSACKMCGMGASKDYKYMRFEFCSEKCMNIFENLANRYSAAELKNIIDRKSVV